MDISDVPKTFKANLHRGYLGLQYILHYNILKVKGYIITTSGNITG